MWVRRYVTMVAVAFAAASLAGAQSLTREPRPVTDPKPGSAAAKLRGRPEPILITDKPHRAGNLGASGVNRTRQRDERATYLQQQTRLRASGSARTGGMAVYQPKDGGAPMLTNRLQKYDSMRGDYTRIRINYDPIVRDRNWGVTFGEYTDTDIHKYVDYYAKLYKVDPSLIHAIIQVESRGNPYAVSPKGAAGLMQLMPGTARDLSVSSVFDPAENIGGGTQFISKLITLFNGDYDLALAGYNAGPETIRRYGGIPPYRETQNYVYMVNLYWSHFKRNGNSFLYTKFDPSLTPAAIKAAAIKEREERIKTRELGDAAKDSHEVKFANGVMHRADDVRHQGDYVYLACGGRTFRLREDQVIAVDGAALLSGEVVTADDIEQVPDATVPLPKDDSVQLAAQI